MPQLPPWGFYSYGINSDNDFDLCQGAPKGRNGSGVLASDQIEIAWNEVIGTPIKEGPP
jgi:hypothetical protein